MTFASSSPLTVRYLRREFAGNGGIPASKRRAGPTNGALRFLVQHANGFTSRLAMKSPLPQLAWLYQAGSILLMGTTQLVAKRIIELAQQGERDPIRLRECVAKGI